MLMQEEIVKKQAQDLIYYLFVDKKIDDALALCAKTVTAFSNLSEKTIVGIEELRDLIVFRWQSFAMDLHLSLFDEQAFLVNDDTASVFLYYCLSDEICLHATFTLKKSGDVWLIHYISFYYDMNKHAADESGEYVYHEKQITRLQKVFSGNKWVVGTFCLKQKDNFPLVYADKKLLYFLGYKDFASFREQNGCFESLVKGDNAEHIVEDFQYQVQNVGDILLECALEKKNGEQVWVGLVGSVTTESSGETLVNILVFNIQNQKNELFQLKKLLQSLTGGFAIYYIDGEDHITPQFYSSGLYKFFRLSSKEFWEVKKNDFYGFVHTDDRQKFVDAIESTIKNNTPLSLEFRSSVHKKTTWLKTYCFIHKNTDGTRLLYVAFADISAQKNLSYRLQMIYDNLQGAIIRCDYDTWEVIETNKFFYELCEFSDEFFKEKYGSNFLSLINEVKREELNYIVKTKDVGECFEFPASMVLGDKKIYILLNGEISQEESRKYINMLLTDTTPIKDNQVLLKKKSKELTLICNSVPSLIFKCSCDEKAVISYANQSFYEYFGYNKIEFSDICRNEFSRLLVEEEGEFLFRNILEDFKNKQNKVQNFECRVITKGGEVKHLFVKARQMFTDGKDPFLYCIAEDKTNAYEYEQGLEYAQLKLQTAISHLNINYWEYNPQTGSAVIYLFNESSSDEFFEVENFVDYILSLKYVNEDYIDVFKDLHAQLQKGAVYVEANILANGLNGSPESWRKIRYSNMFNFKGEPVLSIGTSEDINAYMVLKQRLMSATEQTGVTVWTYDPKTQLLAVENEAESRFIMGNHEKDVPESQIKAGRVFEEDIENYREFFAKMHKGEESATCEVRFWDNHKKEFIWIRLRYSLIPAYQTGYPKVLGTLLDISEQKKAERLYVEQLQLWQLSQEDKYGSLIFNINTKEVISSRLGELTDIAIGDIEAEFRRFRNFIIKEEQKDAFSRVFNLETIIKNYEQGILQGACEFQSRFFNKPMWLYCELKIIKHYERGDLIGLITLSDITKRVIKRKFTDLCLMHQIDFIFQVDIKNDKYQMWNENQVLSEEIMTAVTGYYSYDAPRLLEYYAIEEDRERIIYEMSLPNIVARSKESGNYEVGFRCIRRGEPDEIRYKRFHIFRYDERTATVCLGCIDITELYIEEQRKNDELYQVLEATRQANKAKSSFLASMSHDLRTPMNAIIGMTNLALEDVHDVSQVKESLNIIKTSSTHLLNLLNDILDMAKIESGKMTLTNTTFSIKEATIKICDVFKVIAQQKNIDYQLHFENLKNEFIVTDESRFNRILSNIISNAVKFTPQHGFVKIVVEELGSVKNNITNYAIKVQDSGIGIASEQLKSIFDPFHRVESSMISKIEGSGLGLAIVKALVENLGGTISVESKLGKGSTFVINLSFLKDACFLEEKKADKDIKISEQDFGKISALLVEDHPINIAVIKKILEKMKIKVTVTRDGREGSEAFLNSQPGDFDVIFMDLQMPVMNGYEATARIRSSHHPRAKTIPIVALTANTFEDDIRKCFEVGMNGHIAKPISMEKLTETLKQVIAEKMQ